MNLNRMAGRPLSLAVTAALLINAPLVEAGLFRELSEEALAEMRGKFVVGRHVLYFGMQVSTQWHRPAVPVQAIAVNPGLAREDECQSWFQNRGQAPFSARRSR